MVLNNSWHTTGLPSIPNIFNVLLEYIIMDALGNHHGTVSISSRNLTNHRYANNIDRLAGNEQELTHLVQSLDECCIMPLHCKGKIQPCNDRSYKLPNNQCMKQPLSITLIFPLSPCIIVIDTFMETNLLIA